METKDILAAISLLREADRCLRESVAGVQSSPKVDAIKGMSRELRAMSGTLEYIDGQERGRKHESVPNIDGTGD